MAANNFFGNSSHGEAAPYPAYVGAPPPPPPQPGYTAATAVAGVPAGQVAAPGYARFQTPVTVAPAANYRSATATGAVPAAVYTAYQPVPGGSPAAPYSTAPEGAAQVATAASYPANTYQVYPPGPAPAVPAVPAPAPAPGPGAQQPVFENPKGPVAAAAAATYYGQPRTSQPGFSMSEGGPHFQARPLYSTNSNVNIVAPPTVMSVGAAVPGAANRQPNPAAASSYSSIYSHSNSIPSYTYPAVPTMVNHKPPNLYVHSTPASSLAAAPVGQHPSVTHSAGQPATVSTSYSGTNAWPAHRIGANPQQPKLAPGTNNKHGKIRPQPKPQPLHYCEVCKISCAGPQTYKEHLEGQKHRKKEAANKAAMSNGEGSKSNNGNSVNKSGVSNLRCELCNVTCTGSDAYAAHIRGSKHTKVMKLHSKLGKPIPSIDPIVVSAGVRNNSGKDDHHGPSETRKKRTAEASWVAAENGKNGSGDPDKLLLPDEKEIVPVGGDYIEEIKSDNGKIVSFNCKLCDCKFNDPNAKVMHMKGRRHRLQYKKKVDPELVVDLKPSLRNRKLTPEEQQAKHKMANEEFWKRREEEFRAIEEEEQSYWEERKRFEDDKKSKHPGGHPMGYHPLILRPETIDDRHVIAKHRDIYPSDERLSFVQKHVSNVERALKLVSDVPAVVDQNGVKDDDSSVSKDNSRSLKGVMRVGVLAKGLLLSTDEKVDLVVLCSGRPTHSLLDFIVKHFPEKLKEASGPSEEYDVEKWTSEAAFNVVLSRPDEELPLQVKVTLTSPSIRESKPDSDQSDGLNKDKCLHALASLRRAKWFQARASGRQSCVMVTRVLRELCIREPVWRPMKQYTLELLVEKVLASATVPLSPGDAVRRVFESIASGLLLPNSPGLLDPCEREPQDSAENFTPQERENITAYSQRALRLIAFRQINTVLGMESLPPPRFTRNRIGRKRKLESGEENLDEAKDESSADEEQNQDIADAKKEKKDQPDETS